MFYFLKDTEYNLAAGKHLPFTIPAGEYKVETAGQDGGVILGSSLVHVKISS